MKTLLLALACTAMFAAPVAAATVVNGSFENTPKAVGNWTVFAAGINGWDVASGSGIEIQTNATLGQIDAQDGAHYVELDSHPNAQSSATNTRIQQTIAFDMGRYMLSFYFSPRVRNNAATNVIDFGVTSGLAASITGPSADVPYGQWTKIETIFTVGTAGDYDLYFAASGTQDTLGGLIDNVSISPVPLPASALLLLAGVGALTIARRKSAA